MKIMIDTNVLVSAVYNQDSKSAQAVRDVSENYTTMFRDTPASRQKCLMATCYET
jgi:predicted nucleic acid-binding protein